MIYNISPPWDCECAIELATMCNYRCPYCTGPRTEKAQRRGHTVEDAARVVRFFNESEKDWLIGMSGGEPTIHPQWEFLTRRLSRRHMLHLFTNLSCNVHTITDARQPQGWAWIKASLQPQAEMHGWLEKVRQLHEDGYPITATIVAVPTILDRRMFWIADECARNDIPFTAQPLEGTWEGKLYPRDYTDVEASAVAKYIHEPGHMIRLKERTTGGLNTHGLMCDAGHKSCTLDMETGEFYACESVRESLGNVYDWTFRWRDPIQCPAYNACVGYSRNPMLPAAYSRLLKPLLHGEQGAWTLTMTKDPAALLGADKPAEAQAMVRDKLRAIIGDGTFAFWGAGIYGSKVAACLFDTWPHLRGKCLAAYDKMRGKSGGNFHGVPIRPVPTIAGEVEADKVITTSYAFADEIYEAAKAAGIGDKTVHLVRDVMAPLGLEHGAF